MFLSIINYSEILSQKFLFFKFSHFSLPCSVGKLALNLRPLHATPRKANCATIRILNFLWQVNFILGHRCRAVFTRKSPRFVWQLTNQARSLGILVYKIQRRICKKISYSSRFTWICRMRIFWKIAMEMRFVHLKSDMATSKLANTWKDSQHDEKIFFRFSFWKHILIDCFCQNLINLFQDFFQKKTPFWLHNILYKICYLGCTQTKLASLLLQPLRHRRQQNSCISMAKKRNDEQEILLHSLKYQYFLHQVKTLQV